MSGNSLFPIFKVYDFLNQILSKEPGKNRDYIIYCCASFYTIAILLKVTKIQFLKCNFHFPSSFKQVGYSEKSKIKPGLIRLGFASQGRGEGLRSPHPTPQVCPSGHGALGFVLDSLTFSCWLS